MLGRRTTAQPSVRTQTLNGLSTNAVQLSISRSCDNAAPSQPRSKPAAVASRDGTAAPAPPIGLRAHVCFAWVGFSASWTLADVTWNNMGWFLRCLPGGLMLPDYSAFSGQLAAALTLAIFSLLHLVRGPPGYDASVSVVWLLLLSGLLLTAVAAAGWRTVVEGQAVVVLGTMFCANAIGTISWIATVRSLVLCHCRFGTRDCSVSAHTHTYKQTDAFI